MGEIYKRKIIKIGGQGLGIILPIAWLRYNELDDTNHLKVIVNDHVIIEPIKKGGKHE